MRKLARTLQRKAAASVRADSWKDSEGQLGGYFEDPVQARKDAWQNMVSAIGDPTRDKRMGARFAADRIVDLEAEDIWRGDDMAARAVEVIPDEIMRAGWEVVIKPDLRAKGEKKADGRRRDSSSDVFPDEAVEQAVKEQIEAVADYCDALEWETKFGEAMAKERGYGGGAILPGIRDGEKDLSRPLDFKRIQSVDWLDSLQPLELIPYQWYLDPMGPNYGKPELYWMQRFSVGNIGASQRIPIHESRLIIFPGVVVSPRQVREHWGWGDSILVRMQEVLRDFQQSWQGAALLMQDFSQMVMSIEGLADSFATGEQDLLIERMRMVDLGRSLTRSVIIDAKEKAERQTTPTTGLADLLDRFCTRLAAAAQIPVTLLMGQAPAGLNATGDADVRNFYDSVAAKRRRFLLPRLRRFLAMVFAAKRGPTGGAAPARWSIKFGALWQLTDVQQAEVRKTMADADGVYVDKGVLVPEEIAVSRFGGDEYSMDTHLDRGIRKAYDREAGEEAELEAERLQQQAGELEAEPGTGPGDPGADPRPKPGGKKPASAA